MRGQPGFFDLDERYERLSAVGDPLEKLNSIIRERPANAFPGVERWKL